MTSVVCPSLVMFIRVKNHSLEKSEYIYIGCIDPYNISLRFFGEIEGASYSWYDLFFFNDRMLGINRSGYNEH